MGEGNNVTNVSAYTMYRHLQKYCSQPSSYTIPNNLRKSRLYTGMCPRYLTLNQTIHSFDDPEKKRTFENIVGKGENSAW